MTLQRKWVCAAGRSMNEVKQPVCLLFGERSFKRDLCDFEVQSRPEWLPW